MIKSPDHIQVDPVRDRRGLRAFLHFPYRVYENDPHWVAPLLIDQRKLLDPARHPFYEHSELQTFLAYRGGQVVGRIAAIHNRNHIRHHEEQVGFFGFFEAIDNPAVAVALFDSAAGWLRERGLTAMRGPVNPSTNDPAGLLVEGFDESPYIMMTYNPAYYENLILGAGFEESTAMVAYIIRHNEAPAYMPRLAAKITARTGVTLRPIRMTEFEKELRRIRHIYNAAWEKNWGFVPMTDAELAFMAHELKPIVKKDPELVIMADSAEGEPVGFSLSLKNYNVALKPARGRLLPLGLLKVLWNTRRIDMVRVLTLGLVPEYRGKGIDTLLYYRLFQTCVEKGLKGGEFSWVLEDNHAIRKPLERLGGEIYKRYKLYDRAL
ncbi:MAG: GNAT family N-acetyltransferase [Gemmatimonadota bacterium]